MLDIPINNQPSTKTGSINNDINAPPYSALRLLSKMMDLVTFVRSPAVTTPQNLDEEVKSITGRHYHTQSRSLRKSPLSPHNMIGQLHLPSSIPAAQ